MIHPSTELRFVSPEIGHGVFATEPIPKGTIVYATDVLDVEIDAETYHHLPATLQAIVERYTYMDERGIRVLSWDHGKFVNHRCDCNTMSTGYGFEIALRDIAAGEEITDEYGLFNIPVEMAVSCGCARCRGAVRPEDLRNHHAAWDRRVRAALRRAGSVPQPLWELLDEATRAEVTGFLRGRARYRSVRHLEFVPAAYAGPAPAAMASRSGLELR